MTRLRVQQIGSTRARCRCCGSVATLVVTELRGPRRWSRAPGCTPAVTRSATCQVCVTTYPIRRTDLTAEPAARRRDTVGEPRGRDWAYPVQRPRADRAGRMA